MTVHPTRRRATAAARLMPATGLMLAATGLVLAANLSAQPARAAGSPAGLSPLDANHDNKLDWAEVKAAADRRFASLGPDIGPHHDTLDRRKTKALLSTYMLGISDASDDRTLGQAEWDRIIQRRFRKADTDHDGTLDRSELASPAGQRLLKLCKS